MENVRCNKIGFHKMCEGCGASVFHNINNCEPCPINKEACCTPLIKVFALDDEEFIVGYIQQALTMKYPDKYEVVISTEPMVAQNILYHNSYDVILIDMCMPQIKGDALIRSIQTYYTMSINKPKIIPMTGGGTGQDRIDGLIRSGLVTEFLLKPFSLDEVVLKIDTVLKIKNNDNQYQLFP